MAITSLTEVKALNQISGSSYDATINALIPLVSDYIVTYCRIGDSYAETNPGIRLTAAQMVKFQLDRPSNAGVAGESLGDYSVSYNTNYPDYIMKMLDEYKQPHYITDAYYELYDESVGFNERGTGYKDYR